MNADSACISVYLAAGSPLVFHIEEYFSQMSRVIGGLGLVFGSNSYRTFISQNKNLVFGIEIETFLLL